MFGAGPSLDPSFPDPHNRSEVANFLGKSLLESANKDDYVSEQRIPLNGWTPASELPLHWFACPPRDPRANYRETQLLGWRTNLERAIKNCDILKIKDIARVRDKEEVREFCELRVLLTKMAGTGMLDSCRALLEECRASPDGVFTHGSPRSWREIRTFILPSHYDIYKHLILNL